MNKFRLNAKNLKLRLKLSVNLTFNELLVFFEKKFQTYGIDNYIFSKKKEEDSIISIFIETLKKVDIKNQNFLLDSRFDIILQEALKTRVDIALFQNECMINSDFILSPELEKSLKIQQEIENINVSVPDCSEEINEILLDLQESLPPVGICPPVDIEFVGKTQFSFLHNYSELSPNFSLMEKAFNNLGVFFPVNENKVENLPMILLEGLHNKFESISEIISKNQKSDLVKLQIELETNIFQFYKSVSRLKFSLPDLAKKLVGLFTFLLHSTRIERFSLNTLQSNLNAFCFIEKTKTFISYYEKDPKIPYVSKPSKVMLNFMVYTKILRHGKISLGLIIIHTLSQQCQEFLEKFDFKTNHKIEPFKKKLLTKFSEKREIFSFKRTALKESLTKIVLKQTEIIVTYYLTNNKKYLILEKELNNLVDNIKFTNPELEPEIIKLKLNNFQFEFDQEFISYLGDFIFLVLEKVEIFKERLESNQQTKKETRMVDVKVEFVKSLFSKIPHIIGLPQICKPNDWIIPTEGNKKALNKLSFGGFLINKYNLFPGIKLYTAESFAKINNSNIEALNYLQQSSYSINKDFLCLVEKNFVDCLIAFCNNNLSYSIFDILETSKGEGKNIKKIILKSRSTFFSQYKKEIQVHIKTQIELNQSNLETDLVQEQQDQTLVKYRKEAIKKLSEEEDLILGEAQEIYNMLLSKVFRFFDLYLTGNIFSRFNIYFSWFFCYRARMYITSGAFQAQGSQFVKAMLDLQIDNSPVDLTNPYLLEQIKSWEKSSIKDSSRSFYYFRHLNNITPKVVSFDVSCSGFQIFSGLIGNQLGLIKTNFIVETTEKLPCVKQDIYEAFQDLFLKNYDLNLLENQNFLKVSENHNEIEKSIIDFRVEVVRLIKVFYLERSFIKDQLICFLYSEGKNSRSKKLLNEVLLQPSLIIFIRRFKSYNKNSKDVFFFNSEISNLCLAVSKYFEKTFENLYPEIYQAKIFFESTLVKSNQILNKKGILLKCSDTENSTEIFYNVFKKETIRYTYPGLLKGKKNPSYNMIRDTAEFDGNQAKNKISPNFIHFLEGSILSKVVLKCKQERIPVCTSHDCIRTSFIYENKIKAFYYESFVEVMFSQSPYPFEVFVRANSEENSRLFDNYLHQINRSIVLLKTSLDKGVYKQSPFLLTP